MGRTRSEGAIAKLKKEVEQCENYKKRILDYVEAIKNKHLNKEITYSEYERLINQKLDGRTIQEWLDYYDSYIENCKIKIQREIKKSKTKKVLLIFSFFILISLILFSAFYFKPVIVGFFIHTQEEAPASPSQEQGEPLLNKIFKTITGLITGEGAEEPTPTSESLPEPEEVPTEQVPEAEPEEIPEPVPEIPENITTQEPEENITEPVPEIPAEVPETISEIPENITETPAAPTTPESNITEQVPKENITTIKNITETNATVTTQQYGAIIGKPVKWTKHVQLEQVGIAKIILPKEAENITVNKIQKEFTSEEIQKRTEEIESEVATKELEELKKIREEIAGLKKEIEEVKGILTKKTEETATKPTEEVSKEAEIKTTKQEAITETIREQEASGTETTEQEITEEKITKQEAKATITGGVITETGEVEEKTFFKSILNFFRKIFSTITGRAITTEEQEEAIEVTIDDTALEYEIEYETPAPQAFEEPIGKGKRIIISGPETIHYENILAFTELPQETPEQKIRLYRTTNETREAVNFTTYDTNNNFLIDHIEWIVPSLSNETYELVIEISKAEHLDANKQFISDIYNETYQLDDIWSEPIPTEHYIRVTFKQNLTSDRDITLYPRIVSGAPKIEVYEINGIEKIAEFTNIQSNQYNQVYLTDLQNSQDVFDLKIKDGSIEIDHIIDPEGTLTDTAMTSDITSVDNNSNIKINVSYNCDNGASETFIMWLREDTFNITTACANANFKYISLIADCTGTSGCTNNSDGQVTVTGCRNDNLQIEWRFQACSIDSDNDFTTAGSSTTSGIVTLNNALNNIAIVMPDTIYPTFNSFTSVPANNTAYSSGAIYEFNSTIINTNRTLGLQFNGANYTATNITESVYNRTISDKAVGVYTYRWWSYGNGTSTNFNISTIQSYTIAKATPVITKLLNGGAINVTITYPQQVNATASSTGGTIKIYRDETDVTSQKGLNVTLSAGGYVYKFNVTENANYSSIVGEYLQVNISKAVPQGNLTNTTSWTVNYPAETNISYVEGNLGDGGVKYNVSRNNIYINGGENITLAAGNYVYVLNTTGGTNYTANASMDTKTLIVNKNTTTQTNLTFDKSSPKFYPTPITPTCSIKTGQGTPTLTLNGTTISSGSPITLGVGTWTFNCSIADNGNYTSATNVTTFQITQNNTYALNLTVIPSWNVEYGNQTNVSGNNCPSELTCQLFRNDTTTALSNGINVTLGVGSYNYSYNTTGNANYSARVVASILTVTQASQSITPSLNGNNANLVVTYPQQINASYTGTNQTAVTITINGTQINKAQNYTWGRGTNWNVTWLMPSNQNYSGFATYWNLTVNQATGAINGTINGVQGNFSAVNGSATQNIYINATNIIGDGTGKIRVNGNLYNSGTLPLFNVTNLTIGFYNITFIYDGNENYSTDTDVWWVNVTAVSNIAPQITFVSPVPATDPTENSAAIINFNFTVYDDNGVSNINNASVIANFTIQNETTRANSTCAAIPDEKTGDDKSQNFTCNIGMWYFDGSGNWNVTVYAEDNSASSAINKSTFFQYNQLQSIAIAPAQFSFNVIMGAVNQTASTYTIINNTGNANITEGNIQVQGINLYGATGHFINASNISVDVDTGGTPPAECDGQILRNGTFVSITNAFLPRGNLSAGKAQEQLYYCMKDVPSGIPSQTYSTQNTGSAAWTIKIVATFVFIYASGSHLNKRRQRKKKLTSDDKLLKAMSLILEELKEEYSLNKKEIIKVMIEKLRSKYKISKKEIIKLIREEELEIPISIFSKELGCLEALSKYMKENLNLNYREIAVLLNRDERTIWTAYKKAKQKQPEAIKTEKIKISLPLSIFKNEKLTILEAVINHLKNKGFKYSEIAGLLNRDQRNIWTIYSNAVRKIKGKV